MPVPPAREDAISYDTPPSPQQPLGAAQQQDEKENDGHVPEVPGFADRNSGVGIRDVLAQLGDFVRPAIMAAGLGGKLLEQVAVLLQMEILRHAIVAPERDHVATQLLLAALRGNFSDVGTGPRSVPIDGIDTLLERVRMQLYRLRGAVWPHDSSLHLCVAGW